MSDNTKPYLKQAAQEGQKVRDLGGYHVPDELPNDSTGQAYAPWDTPPTDKLWPTGMSHPQDQGHEARRTSLQQQHEAIPSPRKPAMQQDASRTEAGRTDAADRRHEAQHIEDARTQAVPAPEPER